MKIMHVAGGGDRGGANHFRPAGGPVAAKPLWLGQLGAYHSTFVWPGKRTCQPVEVFDAGTEKGLGQAA